MRRGHKIQGEQFKPQNNLSEMNERTVVCMGGTRFGERKGKRGNSPCLALFSATGLKCLCSFFFCLSCYCIHVRVQCAYIVSSGKPFLWACLLSLTLLSRGRWKRGRGRRRERMPSSEAGFIVFVKLRR